MAIKINTTQRKLVNTSGKLALESQSRPNIIYGDNGILEFDCVDDSNTAVAFAETDTFELWADIDYNHTTDSGTANAAYSGVVTSIVVNGLTQTLQTTGFLILENSDGDRDRVAYTAYVSATGTFTVDDTLINTFAEGDTVYIEDQLCMYSGNSVFNNVADRADVDVTAGKICVSYDALTKGFAAKITSKKLMHLEIWRYPAGSTHAQKILQDDIYASPTVGTIEGAPASADPEYMTAAAITAALATKADALPSDAVTLTGGATTNIELGAVTTYSVFEITVKIIDDSGDYNIMLLTCSNNGTTALISHEGGHNSATLARFDGVIESDVNTDISGGIQRLNLSVDAGANYTCKYQITNRM
jgi:hypothetical protein